MSSTRGRSQSTYYSPRWIVVSTDQASATKAKKSTVRLSCCPLFHFATTRSAIYKNMSVAKGGFVSTAVGGQEDCDPSRQLSGLFAKWEKNKCSTHTTRRWALLKGWDDTTYTDNRIERSILVEAPCKTWAVKSNRPAPTFSKRDEARTRWPNDVPSGGVKIPQATTS